MSSNAASASAPAENSRRAGRGLAAKSPSNRLEALHGDREGQSSIRINDQWRICFVWRNGETWYVEIVDYH